MIALCVIREQPHYRRDAFVRGLQRAGYTITDKGRPQARDDLLVIWNRYGLNEAMADRWEELGGSVLVAENGYVGKDANGHQLYALAVHGHNGAGWWPSGDEDRFAALNLEVLPWVSRPDGYALICGQRGIGSKQMASPPNWHVNAARLWKRSPIRMRLHPGNNPAPNLPKLEDDLAGAQACVIWSSSSGVKALLAGIPVYYDAPHWICADAAMPLRKSFEIEQSSLDELRLQALRRMAYAQWTIAELETGEPFVRLREGLGSASW